MNVRVIVMFRDKYDPKQLHRVGDVLKNITKERLNEIKDFVEVIEKTNSEEIVKKSNRRG